MKTPLKNLLRCLCLLVLLLPVSAAQAAGEPRLQLSARHAKLKVGESTTVDVLVEGAPPIYGADIQLTFDPAFLEVIDVDPNQTGIQIETGNFLDPKQSFSLQHRVDNEKGTIDFAQTLLNPAPAAEGKGQLAQITFRAKAEGETSIAIQEGLFGTQTGETVTPELEGVAIRIAGAGSQAQVSLLDKASAIGGQIESGAQNPLTLGIVAVSLLAGLGGAGIAVRRHWFKRSCRVKSTRGHG